MTHLLQLFHGPCAAALLLALGVIILVLGFGNGVRGARRCERDPMRALALMRGFRVGVIGFALALIGTSWLWHIGWLFGLALVIGGQELLESSVLIAALRYDVRRQGRPIATRPAIANRIAA